MENNDNSKTKVQITAVLFDDAEAWLRENVNDLSMDSIQAVHPRQTINLDGLTKYRDSEENTTKLCSLDDHIKGLRLLCEQIGNKKLFVGGLKNPADLLDAGNWDVEVADAFFQLVYHGEVIYG